MHAGQCTETRRANAQTTRVPNAKSEDRKYISLLNTHKRHTKYTLHDLFNVHVCSNHTMFTVERNLKKKIKKNSFSQFMILTSL